MQVIVSENSVYERTLEVTLDQSNVDSAYERAFGKAARRLALPGFRRGKVPITMAKKYISEDGLGGDVVDDLVPRAFYDALAQEKLRPISEPKWELVQRQRGKDLIFKVKFEVRPSFQVADYKGVELKAEEFDATDEQVEQALLELRQSRSTVETVDPRPLRDGDIGVVDYTASKGGEPFDGGSAEGALLELKSENFIPGFIEKVVGIEPGQEREFDITFPEDYANKDLAGQEVHFKFQLKELKERRIPELTDEFAVSLNSGFENAEALRNAVRERIQGSAERQARESVSMRIVQRLLHQIPEESVPRSLFSWRANVEMRRRLQELSRAGIALEKYLETVNMDQQKWIEQQSAIGMIEARIQLLLESIADAENLHPSEDEVSELFQVEAAQRGVTVEQLKKVISQDNSDELVSYAILSAKVRDFLFENANITFVPKGTPIEDPSEAKEAKPAKSKSKAKADEAAAEGEGEDAKPAKAKAKKAKVEEAPTEAPAEAEEAKPAKAKAKKTKADEAAAEAAPAEEEKPKAKRPAKKKTEE